MGLFSSKKKVYVASTVYNMVDDDSISATYMQQALTSAVLTQGPQQSLGQGIVNSHLRGPRKRQREFFRWAKANMDYGMPRGALNYTEIIDHTVVAAEIKTALSFPVDDTVDVIDAFIDNADEAHYAEQYILENHPEKIDTTWAADFDNGTIHIQFEDSTSASFAAPAGFNSSDSIMVAYYYRTIHPNTDQEPIQTYIYKIGSGNSTLDAYRVELTDGAATREFYPALPLRIDNKNPFATGSPAKNKRDDIEKAYEKAIGGDINELISEIEDNQDIGDIDYAYLVFGVPLNTDSQFGKRYIWQFMKTMADLQGTSNTAYDNYQTANNANGYNPRWTNAAVSETTDPDVAHSGSTASATRTQAPQVSDIHLTLPTSDLGVLDMKITWSDIKEERITGIIAQGAKPGQVEIGFGGSYQQRVDINVFGGATLGVNQTMNEIVIQKQINALEYIKLTVRGFQHKNLIYGGKSVDITGKEALQDDDTSGFLFPLHEPTLRAMGLISATEVARDCYHIVFNSYKVVKKKWYQRGIFKIFLVAIVITAIVVAAIYTAGASLGPSSALLGGILGSSVAIGASLGFTGLLALAIGTFVNVLAAMIITQLLTFVATEVIGGKLGRILAVAVTIAMSFAQGPGGFSNIGANVASLGHIDKLLALTNAAADITGVINQDKMEDILKDTEDLMQAHDEEVDRLKEAYDALGFGDRVIDPMMLVDFSGSRYQMGENWMGVQTETTDEFISRTLASGSDLAELSLGVVNDFVDISLTLP